jgi:hypothetical protein
MTVKIKKKKVSKPVKCFYICFALVGLKKR